MLDLSTSWRRVVSFIAPGFSDYKINRIQKVNNISLPAVPRAACRNCSNEIVDLNTTLGLDICLEDYGLMTD
jgi:hypothetical protein